MRGVRLSEFGYWMLVISASALNAGLYYTHVSGRAGAVVRGDVRRRHVHSDEYMLGDGGDGAGASLQWCARRIY
ncbi:unnamed protein product [Sphagnum balticum]